MPKTTIFDVAEYILSKSGTITAMKLERLCYYAQAWSLVWDERPLFGEEFQAWANGPVCPELYARHRGEFTVTSGGLHGDPGVLDQSQRDTVDAGSDITGRSPHMSRPRWSSASRHGGMPVAGMSSPLPRWPNTTVR